MAGLIPFSSTYPSFFNTGFDDFYSLLDDFFSDGKMLRRNMAKDIFRLDISENEKEYTVTADLPGVKKDEIDIALNEGRLSITVNRKEEKEDKKENFLHRERHCCSMKRSVYLGDYTDSSDIKAKLEEGVLTVTVQKKQVIDNTVKVEIE